MVEIGTTVPKPVLHTHLMKDILNIEQTQRRATKYAGTEWLYQLIQNLIDKTDSFPWWSYLFELQDIASYIITIQINYSQSI